MNKQINTQDFLESFQDSNKQNHYRFLNVGKKVTGKCDSHIKGPYTYPYFLAEATHYNDDKQWGIFYVINNGGQKSDEIKEYTSLYIDIDITRTDKKRISKNDKEEAKKSILNLLEEKVEEGLIPQISIITHSKNGFHLYLLLKDRSEWTEEKWLDKQIQFSFMIASIIEPVVEHSHIDTKPKQDKARVFSVPGFFHAKEELDYKIKAYGDKNTYTYAELNEYFKEDVSDLITLSTNNGSPLPNKDNPLECAHNKLYLITAKKHRDSLGAGDTHKISNLCSQKGSVYYGSCPWCQEKGFDPDGDDMCFNYKKLPPDPLAFSLFHCFHCGASGQAYEEIKDTPKEVWKDIQKKRKEGVPYSELSNSQKNKWDWYAKKNGFEDKKEEFFEEQKRWEEIREAKKNNNMDTLSSIHNFVFDKWATYKKVDIPLKDYIERDRERDKRILDNLCSGEYEKDIFINIKEKQNGYYSTQMVKDKEIEVRITDFTIDVQYKIKRDNEVHNRFEEWYYKTNIYDERGNLLLKDKIIDNVAFDSVNNFKKLILKGNPSLNVYITENSSNALQMLKKYLGFGIDDYKKGVMSNGLIYRKGIPYYIESGRSLLKSGEEGEAPIEDLSFIKQERSSIIDKEQISEADREELINNMLKFNHPFITLPFVGWSFYCFIQHLLFDELRMRFPFLYCQGERGSGKTVTIKMFLKLFNSTFSASCAGTTEFAMLKILSSNNMVPVFFDEYKPDKLRDIQAKVISNLCRGLYDKEIISKGDYNGLSQLREYHLLRPLFLAGEVAIDEGALNERSVEIQFAKAMRENYSEENFKYIERMKWGELGKDFLLWIMNKDVSFFVDFIKGTEYKNIALSDRHKNNFLCIYWGLTLLSYYVKEKCSKETSESFMREIHTHVPEYLRSIQSTTRECEDETACMEFLKDVQNMVETNKINWDVHYKIEDDTDRLILYMPGLYPEYTKYLKDKNLNENKINKRTIQKQIVNTDYFIGKDKNYTLKNVQKHVYILDHKILKDKYNLDMSSAHQSHLQHVIGESGRGSKAKDNEMSDDYNNIDEELENFIK